MGERALVVFTNGEEVSPAVYLHWHGEVVPQLLKLAATVMAGDPKSGYQNAPRIGDVSYSAARFVGVCHSVIDGNLSLGLQLITEKLERGVRDLIRPTATAHARVGAVRLIRKEIDGMWLDAGYVVVDVRAAEWSWRAFGGYLEKDGWSGLEVGAAA